MIQSLVLLRIFHSHHIADILHHTHRRSIPRRIRTNLADIRVGYIMADLTIFHFTLQLDDSVAKCFYSLQILTKQVQHQPHGRFSSDAGKLGKLPYCFFQ